MAAALFRRGSGLCCLHRELCRVVWRPQTALLSSKPSDRKQPRRTHIKKAKPQPALDVSKLLEQLFSQRRPDTASPTARLTKASSSSSPTKPPTTSSVNVSSSNVPPLSNTNARSLSNVTVPVSSGSSPAAAIELQPSAETIETKVETTVPLSAHEVEKNAETATVETSIEPPVEAVETLETRAAVVEGPVESTVDVTVDAAAQEVETNSTDSGVVDISPLETLESQAAVEYPVDATVETNSNTTKEETTIETQVEAVETLETRVAEGPVESTVDAAAQEVDSGVVNVSYSAKEESLIETTIETPVEISHETSAAVVEGPVEPTIDVTVDAAAQEVETNSKDSGHSAKEEPLIETTIDATVEANTSPLETLESRAAVAEGSVETTIEADTAAQAIKTNGTLSHIAEEDLFVETTIETQVEAVETLETRAAVVESPVESTVETNSTDSEVVSYRAKPLIETTIEPEVSEAVIQNAKESAPLPLEIESTVESSSVNEDVSRSEEMTLESVTLHVDQVLVASLETEELLQTKSILDEKAEQRLQELSSVQTEVGAAAESEDSSEDESEDLNVILSKWDSLSEDLQELEGGTELLCHVPAELSKTHVEQTEAMTLESVTLAEVTAEVGRLDTEVLEKEAEEEKMEVTTTIEDVVEFEEDILTLESISEATDAIEAVMLEVMLGSEQGPMELVEDQEAEEESVEQRGNVVEAMSLESVTLAEVEASLRTLDDESLSETTDYLEKEAEIVAGEKEVEVEVEVESEETTLEIESLPEDLQIDALMEELIFSVPGHVTRGQEGVRSDVLDETVTAGSVDVDTAAVEEVTDDVPASPAQEEVLLEEEEGSEDVKGTHADLDPVQRLFLEKIREYNNMRRLNGGLLEAEPDYEKLLSEETAKLQRLYGGGDLSSFPQFTFTEPKMDRDSK